MFGFCLKLAELATALRLPREDSETLSRIFKEGCDVNNWLLSLDEALYNPPLSSSATPLSLTTTSEDEDSWSQWPAFCRLRHDIPRRELDKCLSELKVRLTTTAFIFAFQ